MPPDDKGSAQDLILARPVLVAWATRAGGIGEVEGEGGGSTADTGKLFPVTKCI